LLLLLACWLAGCSLAGVTVTHKLFPCFLFLAHGNKFKINLLLQQPQKLPHEKPTTNLVERNHLPQQQQWQQQQSQSSQ